MNAYYGNGQLIGWEQVKRLTNSGAAMVSEANPNREFWVSFNTIVEGFEKGTYREDLVARLKVLNSQYSWDTIAANMDMKTPVLLAIVDGEREPSPEQRKRIRAVFEELPLFG